MTLGERFSHAHYRHYLDDKCKYSKIKFTFQFPTLGGFFLYALYAINAGKVLLTIIYQSLVSISNSAQGQKMAQILGKKDRFLRF